MPGTGTTYNGNPSNYRSLLSGLKPGDTLVLAPGNYNQFLPLYNLKGTASAPITITGPTDPSTPAVFLGDVAQNSNTIEIGGSSYLKIMHLKLDGQNIAGVDGVKAKDSPSDHITIESLTIVNHGATQQTDGISTKVATWNWVIRKNIIIGAGTGIYLGNSVGSDAAPFVGGTIEGNLVVNPLGYCMEIKPQNDQSGIGADAGHTTVIRHNTFIKGDGPCTSDGCRPNVLVSSFPPGFTDMYEIYGNVFYHNPNESLLQASGRVSLHDNLFIDDSNSNFSAALFTNHIDTAEGFPNDVLTLANVYHNTIYSTAHGIHFSNAPSQGGTIFGNAVFSDDPISGSFGTAVLGSNFTDTTANATSALVQPSTTLGSMDFYPKAGQLHSPVFSYSAVASDHYGVDFNGTSRTGLNYYGAYSGEGTNPGPVAGPTWTISNSVPKPIQ